MVLVKLKLLWKDDRFGHSHLSWFERTGKLCVHIGQPAWPALTDGKHPQFKIQQFSLRCPQCTKQFTTILARGYLYSHQRQLVKVALKILSLKKYSSSQQGSLSFLNENNGRPGVVQPPTPAYGKAGIRNSESGIQDPEPDPEEQLEQQPRGNWETLKQFHGEIFLNI